MQTTTKTQKSSISTILYQPFSTLAYTKKTIICGNFIRHYIYEKPIFRGYTSNKLGHDKKDALKSSVDQSQSHDTEGHVNGDLKTEHQQQKRRHLFSIHRTRDNVFNTIQTNLTKFTKFITLTTRETILDRDEFLIHFNQFRIKFQKTFKQPLKYIGILERQKKRGKKENNLGSIHIHLIVFNDDYLPFKQIKQLWHHVGSIDIKKVKNDELGQYMAKYLTKENSNDIHESAKKMIFKSKNLKKPIIIYDHDVSTTGITNELGEIYKNVRLFQVYSTSYQRKHYTNDDQDELFSNVYLKEFSTKKKKIKKYNNII